jgi:hypothetical protein
MAYTGRASLPDVYGARQPDVRRPGFALIDRQGHHSTIIAPLSFSQKQLSQKRLGERGGHSVKFRLFRDPETAGSPQGGSLGAAG